MSNTNSKYDDFKRFMLDFLSGGISGAIAKTVSAPMERVKLLMQTQTENMRLNRQYNGIIDCLVRCFKEEGPLSLWRGNGVNIIRYFPTQALNFSFKERFTKLCNPYNPKTEPKNFFWGSLLAGGMAGSATICFVYPLDFARTRLGVDIGRSKEQRQFKGIKDCLLKVYKSDGFAGLYRGFGICLFGIFIYRGLYFGTYDAGKEIILKEKYKNKIIYKFLFAQIVVIYSETIAYPTDTIKRKMMMQSARGEKLYVNSIDCAIQMYKKQGITSFFVGNASNIFRSFGSSICLVLYDEIRNYSRKF
ncbi:hypothetical protein ABPG72_015643 [Tetrahymena utriculariae]